MAESIPAHLKNTFKKVRTLIVKDKNFAEARQTLAGIPDGELYTPYHIAMGAIAKTEGDTPVAMAHLEKALSLSPEDIRLISRVGKIRLQEGNKNLAQDYANRALQLKPSRKADVIALAGFLQQLGDSSTAGQLLREAVLKNPNDTRLRRLLAISQLQVGQYDESERNLNNCLRLDPKNHFSQILLGEILIAKGDKSRGLAALRSANNEDCPPKLRERLSLDAAECYIDLAEYSAAKGELTRILGSNNPRFNYCWGKIQFEESDYESALSSLIAASQGLKSAGDTAINTDLTDPAMLSEGDQKNRSEKMIHDLAGKLEKLKASELSGADNTGIDSIDTDNQGDI
jgi:Flp pilus assembly protein TadD